VEHNPYQSPQAIVADPGTGQHLASRGARLGAALLDSLIIMVVLLPVMYVGGYFSALLDAARAGEQLPFFDRFMWGVIGISLVFAIQFVPLKNSGQTWGKKIVGVKIVDMDGEQPGLGVLLGRRYLVYNGVGLIPFLGGLISLVNILCIFRGDKRCLHDLVAGTQVVNAE
jgi:uncharacterized RDD family membrane protein YckC